MGSTCPPFPPAPWSIKHQGSRLGEIEVAGNIEKPISITTEAQFVQSALGGNAMLMMNRAGFDLPDCLSGPALADRQVCSDRHSSSV